MVFQDRARRRVLTTDSAANYLLGLPLLAVPRQTAALLGLPAEASTFYQRVLGGVLTGVATALAIERNRSDAGPVGLGTAGAIAINTLGGGSVALWLASSEARALTLRGRLLLGGVATGVLAIGAVEAWGERRGAKT
jgi:hypothetical protein